MPALDGRPIKMPALDGRPIKQNLASVHGSIPYETEATWDYVTGYSGAAIEVRESNADQ